MVEKIPANLSMPKEIHAAMVAFTEENLGKKEKWKVYTAAALFFIEKSHAERMKMIGEVARLATENRFRDVLEKAGFNSPPTGQIVGILRKGEEVSQVKAGTPEADQRKPARSRRPKSNGSQPVPHK